MPRMDMTHEHVNKKSANRKFQTKSQFYEINKKCGPILNFIVCSWAVMICADFIKRSAHSYFHFLQNGSNSNMLSLRDQIIFKVFFCNPCTKM